MSTNTVFSDSWHRVANFSVQLKTEIHVHKQLFRGDIWYVLQDPFNNSFYRIRQGAWGFISRLRWGRSVEEVWKECVEFFPEEAPGQVEVVSLLAQLHQCNLILSNMPADSAAIFERYKKTQQKEVEAQLKSFMTPRFPIFNPDPFLRVVTPLFQPFFGRIGFALWLVLVFLGLKEATEHWDELKAGASAALAPGNFFWLYIAGVIIKAFHEFGHGIACRARGGQVPSLGILLMVFVPLPYVDATASYAFRKKQDRILVASAGMIFDFLIAALAIFIWSSSPPGIVKSLAYNVMLTASISTLLFNLNPLLKFDGYYIFADLIDVPNLQQRGNEQLRHLCERYLFGRFTSYTPAYSLSEAWILTLYGLAAFAYRIFLIILIATEVSDMFWGLGMLLALVLLVLWVIVPLIKGIKYVFTSIELHPVRARAIGVSLGLLALVVLVLGVMPYPVHTRSSGVLEAREAIRIYSQTPGYVTEILTGPNQEVRAGQPLLRMVDPEMEEKLRALRARIEMIEAKRQIAERGNFNQELLALQMDVRSLRSQLARLLEKKQMLTVRAPIDGTWIAVDLEHLPGHLLMRGEHIGSVIRPSGFFFSAVISQQNVSLVALREQVSHAEIRLNGQVGRIIPVADLQFIPAEQLNLPSAALSWRMGGQIKTKDDDQSGLMATEPFYLIRASLPDGISRHGLFHHRRGYIRLTHHWEPLLFQWYRSALKQFQKRYTI